MDGPKYLKTKGRYWIYQRRVPHEVSHLDPRRAIQESTGVEVARDKKGRRAASVVRGLNRAAEAYWKALKDGAAGEASAQYEAARLRARSLGFNYMPVEQLAKQPIAEILLRLDQLLASDQPKTDVIALLGGAEKPRMRLSQLLEEYEALTRSSRSNHSLNQLRKWRGSLSRAVKNLTDVLARKYPHDDREGDLFVDEITREDALDFVDRWQDRIETEGKHVRTANRDIGGIHSMLTLVDQKKRLGLTAPFAGLRLRGGVDRKRPPFKAAFVRDHILAAGALGELNDQARDVVYLLAATGLRPSEACNLTEETIFLETPVPYIAIIGAGRSLKTANSAREFPLTGLALEVMKRNPMGFPRYRDKSDPLSAIVMKTLSAKQLLPTPAHSLYSLRHTFKDRLREVGAPEELIDRLMGHKTDKPDYGEGHSIRLKLEWLRKIEFQTRVAPGAAQEAG